MFKFTCVLLCTCVCCLPCLCVFLLCLSVLYKICYFIVCTFVRINVLIFYQNRSSFVEDMTRNLAYIFFLGHCVWRRGVWRLLIIIPKYSQLFCLSTHVVPADGNGNQPDRYRVPHNRCNGVKTLQTRTLRH